jgi:hypothetical protein
MAFPAHLSKNLRRKLGEDTGGDLVTWLEEMRGEHEQSLAVMRTEHEQRLSEIRADGARLLQRMDDLVAKIDERFAKVDERLAGLQVAIADSKAELMKWMLVFWVGAVGAIAALAGVFRL